MPLGSPQKSIIKSLIESIKYEIDEVKLYDALRKMHDDINKSYESLFEGPLPAVSGKNLDLTEVPENKFPSTVAFTDKENLFTEDQTIQKLRPTFELQNKVDATTSPTSRIVRMQEIGDLGGLFASGISYNGSNFVLDTGTAAAGILFDRSTAGQIELIQFIASVLKYIIRITPAGITAFGDITDFTNAVINDVVLKNQKDLRGQNAAANKCYSLIRLDANDLVGVASDSEATGKGHFAIPHTAAANLPAAAAAQNGTVVIDDTNLTLCYYTGGGRYALTGVAF